MFSMKTVAALAALVAGATTLNVQAAVPTTLHGDMYYYQTQYSNGSSGNYVSLAPTWQTLNPATGKPYVTNIFLAAGHFGYDSDGTPYIHLNDNRPGDAWFDPMWPEVAEAQSHGIKVHFMLGGSAPGTYSNLIAHPEIFYPLLKQTLVKYKLDGIDLDVEESVPLAQIERLITQLHKDFGDGFAITLAPVATDLIFDFGLSGFSYKQLYQGPAGQYIAWFNTQFYNGWGDMSTTTDYDAAVANGFPASKVVAGALDSPHDGSGYVDIRPLATTVRALSNKYPTFAGTVGWEYFDAEPGGPNKPITFAVDMGKAMR